MDRKLFIGIILIVLPVLIQAQFISRVLEYTPAPGQYINSSPWGWPASASSLIGGVNGHLSLGAYGGTVVFSFAEAVENDPDNPYGIDFTIFGNPLSDWSEPGIVWVMKDENLNGEPDEQWYQLAGSDYYFSTTQKSYDLNYFNPGGTQARDIPWTDAYGSSGYLRANSSHTQSYYPLADSFPAVQPEQYLLSGTRIQGAVDVDHPPVVSSLRRAFGYADNQLRGEGPSEIPDNPYTPEVENSGGDAFDISWAVDENGKRVELDVIHFIKVQNGLLHAGGVLGELSTEISGAIDVSPDPSRSGPLECLVLRDLPAEVDTGIHSLEVWFFHAGIPEALPALEWSCSETWAWVDQELRLIVRGSGPLTVNARVSAEPALSASIRTLVNPELGTSSNSMLAPEPSIFPNPARSNVRIRTDYAGKLYIRDLNGKILLAERAYQPGIDIDLSELAPGLYLLQLIPESQTGMRPLIYKLLKH